MVQQTCPSCAQPASGRFCSHCGAGLEGAPCAACGNTLPAGGRFCNQCGVRAGGPAEPAAASPPAADAARARLPWVVAGVAVVALLAFLVVPRLREESPAGPASPALAGPAAGAAGQGSRMPTAEELAQMDPREVGDRLFNRVMEADAAGDSARARMFIPMALQTYQSIPDLDLDGRYHVAVLHLVAQDAPAARAEAQRILDAEPNHLFGLYVAAEAERRMGNQEAARGFFRRFLESYDAESARDLAEYRDHARVLPLHREEAQRALAES